MTESRFLAHVVEQHFENVADLWLSRANAVRRSALRLVDLVKLDARIEANIDGLRVGAWNGWPGPQEELASHGAGEFFGAGVLALETGEPERLDQVIALAAARSTAILDLPYHPADDPWRGLVSAFSWVDGDYARPAMERLLGASEQRCRWLAIAAVGARRNARFPDPELLLADPQPLVRARGARTLGELGRRDQQAPLRDLLTDADDDVRFWAAWSGARLGLPQCTPVLASFATAASPRCDQALDLLLRCVSIREANAFIRPWAQMPERRRTLIRAVGVIGDAVYLPWLIKQAADPAFARSALASFAAVAGVTPADVAGEAPPDAPATVNDDPQDETVLPDDEDALPWPEPAKLGHWWEANQARFSAGTPYFLGSPKSSANWLEALWHAPQWLRRVAALELALRRSGEAMFEVRARGDVQQRLLRRVGQTG